MFKKIPLKKNPQKMKNFLRKINNNNIKALKISLFKETILTSEFKKLLGDKYSSLNPILKYWDGESSKSQNINFNKKYFDMKIEIKRNELKKLINKNDLDALEDVIFNKYVKYDIDNNDFNKCKDSLFAVTNGYILEAPILIYHFEVLDLIKNEYNEKSLAKDWDEHLRINRIPQDNWKFFNDKKCLENEINNYENLLFDIDYSHSSHSLIRELLFKGNHTIRVYYIEQNILLTEKGIEKLKYSWWKDWKWLIPTILSIISLVIPIILKKLY